MNCPRASIEVPAVAGTEDRHSIVTQEHAHAIGSHVSRDTGLILLGMPTQFETLAVDLKQPEGVDCLR